MRPWPILFPLLVVAAMAGCSETKPIVLTAADNGRTIEILRGAEVLVSLESNRTTGYAWTQSCPLSGPLASAGEPIYVAAAASTGAVGVGGIETWRFRAANSGEQRLTFEYRRPFENEMAPARTVMIDIRVR